MEMECFVYFVYEVYSVHPVDLGYDRLFQRKEIVRSMDPFPPPLMIKARPIAMARR